MPPKTALHSTNPSSRRGRGKRVVHEENVEHARGDSSGSDAGSEPVPLPDDLRCGICHDLLTGAMQTPCCGGLSCKECIETVAVTTKSCPYCRAEPLTSDKLHVDVRMERMASCYVRRCELNGCGFRGSRDELTSHARSCLKRPVAEVLAELRETDSRWRKQRCWQLSSHLNHNEINPQGPLELLMCRIHVFFGTCCDPSEPREDSIDSQPCADASAAMMPLTTAQLFSNVGSPCVRISHVQDQEEPTWCYVIKAHAPGSARRIAIPAKSNEAVVVRDLLTAEECQGVRDPCLCHDTENDDENEENEEECDECACGLHVFLAKTLADFGLTEELEYADDTIDPY